MNHCLNKTIDEKLQIEWNEIVSGNNIIIYNFLSYDLILGSPSLKTIINKAKYVIKAITLVNTT